MLFYYYYFLILHLKEQPIQHVNLCEVSFVVALSIATAKLNARCSLARMGEHQACHLCYFSSTTGILLM